MSQSDKPQQPKRWRVKGHGDDLITYWKSKPRHSNEYAAAEIIEELERELADAQAAAETYVREPKNVTPRQALRLQAIMIEQLRGEVRRLSLPSAEGESELEQLRFEVRAINEMLDDAGFARLSEPQLTSDRVRGLLRSHARRREVMVYANCPRCGANDDAEAKKKCQPDQDGDCPMCCEDNWKDALASVNEDFVAQQDAAYWDQQAKIDDLEAQLKATRSATGDSQDAARYRFWREFYGTRFAITLGEQPPALKFVPSRPAVEAAGEDYRAKVDAALDDAMRRAERGETNG